MSRADSNPSTRLRDPFADDVLERLARSNQDYQREHGHYIVPLAERLLRTRRELEQAERTWKNQQAITRDEMRRSDEYQEAYRRAEDDLDKAKTRLAKVPALVEALRAFVEPDPHTDGYGEIDRGAAALADWEQDS